MGVIEELALHKQEEATSSESIMKQKFDVIIPAYDEEERIGPVLDEVCSFIYENELPWKVIVSIDGNDGTEEIVFKFSRTYNFVIGLKHERRSGYGGAVKSGIYKGSGDYIIILEADGAMNFIDVVSNLHFLRDYDIINFDRHSGNEKNIPFIRRLLSRGYNLYVRVLFNINVGDIQGGYKIFKMEAARTLFKKITITDGFFQAALFYYAKKMNLKVVEINVPYRHRRGSKFGVGNMILGGLVSGLALRVRNSPLYKYVQKNVVELYYRKFRWI